MIDVWAVAANGLWVVGLALALAALSWASWAANVEGERCRQVLGRPGLRRWVDVGLALFCAGLAATSGPWWQRVFWAPLAGACVVDAAVARPHREGGTDDVP